MSGDTNAYEEIVRSHQGKVLGLCLSFLSSASEAEDAAQEIFIKAYKSLRSFKGDSKFSTWLYRVAANHCKDLLRKRSREKTQSLDALMEESGEREQKLFEPSFNPIAASEAKDEVQKMLSFLTPDERLILTLREVQGLSYDEMTQVLGCSLDAVKSRLKRARGTLQEKARHFLKARSV